MNIRNAKKKNKIYVGLDSLFIWAVILVITVVFNILVFYEFSKNNDFSSTKVVIWIILHIFSSLFFVFASFITNRSCNIVYFCNGLLHRKGLFFGFDRKVAIKDIIQVEKVKFHLDGEYYALIDEGCIKNDRIHMRSCIFVPATKNGDEFIKRLNII